MKNSLRIHPDDNVAVALQDLPQGMGIPAFDLHLQDRVPQKHKFTLYDLAQGAPVMMYGLKVGTLSLPLKAGSLLASRHIQHATEKAVVRPSLYRWYAPDVSPFSEATWKGYLREDGNFGTRNHWLVIPLVFCENRNVEALRKIFDEQLGYGHSLLQYDLSALKQAYLNNSSEALFRERPGKPQRFFKNVEGIKYLTHHSGCGGTRQDAEMLIKLLAAYLVHPNTAGATVLSLGCQNAQMQLLQQELRRLSPGYSRPVVWAEQQAFGSQERFMDYLIKESFAGMAQANKQRRQKASIRKLTLGLECGGSDGFSGISANPALGEASDLLVALGGSSLLAEFPELNGVEQELIDRCTNIETAERFSQLMQAYEKRALAAGSSFAANPSPGNIKDGLLTDAMKSAGAAKKGGTAPIVDVLDYTEKRQKSGLNLLCTPGNDVESTTALAASGANLIVFTTGLGTPTGNPLSPVLKMSSNTALAHNMPDIIDIDAGGVIRGEHTPMEVGEQLLRLMLKVASGESLTKAEQLGQDDFIPWKRDISL